MQRSFFLAALSIVFFSASLSSCAPFSYKRQKLVSQVSRGDYERALSTQARLQKGKPHLIDLMDKGLILHHLGEYEESNRVSELAEKKIEELYTKSLSREVSTYLVNDLTQAYSGEEFERIYVHILMAFNYIGLGNLEEALVEIRKIDFNLQVYADQYQGRSVFKNHAFAHYLSGLVHEAGDELNDAFISYRKALSGYEEYEHFYGVEIPRILIKDLLYSSYALGFF